ncbi:MAG: phosphoribosylformylglycinamidine synthase subunit PurL [Chloroflexota bacterium]
MSFAVTTTKTFTIAVQPSAAQPHSVYGWPDLSWQVAQLFFLQGQLTENHVQKLAAELLTDPLTETFSFSEVVQPSENQHIIDITLLPGVTDPVAENLLQAAHWIGIETLTQAATGQRYIVQGNASPQDLARLATEVFSNPVIQRFTVDSAIEPPFVAYHAVDDTVDTIPLRHATEDQLTKISAERRLSLNLAEMQAIQLYYQHEDREPTDAELEMIAQTWSEHCVHKTFKARIHYTSPDGEQLIDGLLNTYIRAATNQIAKAWVYSAFVDNAGIIRFNDDWDLAFKVETHNHPSALEPFGGANTGVGGVVRDILGVSARPIANTDVLCFGWPDTPLESLQAGVLHPRRIAEGVVHGVQDYGNKMGIPTVNGAVLFHEGYTSNPLVFCGCLGLLPHGSHVTDPQPGDLIAVVGGRTGRDGLRGATFSSMEMDTTTSTVAGSAVQIGHPIHEKQVLEVILRARDAQLYNAITDCGAGGLSSAVGEMAKTTGARVQLDSVPLKYPGLRPWEIWLSEAQERMVLAIPPRHWQAFLAICNGEDIEAVQIGTLEATDRLRLYYGDKLVGDLDMAFLHDGIPQMELNAVWEPIQSTIGTDQTTASSAENYAESLLTLLAHPDIQSKESIVRRYDHEVQGSTALKPLVGVDNHGPGDASILIPRDTQLTDPKRGIAISNGVCPSYGDHDPYAMAWATLDEAMRNLVAVGADPDSAAILDNFCWGNPRQPDRLGSLVRCVQGCYDAALAYGTPFISGKDSLNNEYIGADGQRHAIPGTLVISAIGIVPDVQHSVSMDLKQAGNLLYVIGATRDELGGSHYHLIHNRTDGTVPQPVPDALHTMRTLYSAIQADLVQACHDCSEGGLAVTLAEMCIAGRLGAAINLAEVSANPMTALFAESLNRFVVEVRPADSAAFEVAMQGIQYGKIGSVDGSGAGKLTIIHAEPLIDISVTELERVWRGEQIVTAPDVQPVATTVRTDHTILPKNTSKPRVLILHATGSNRDRDAAAACELAGGVPEIVHINQLLSGERHLMDYQMLVLPGGFSYGDDLGAGKLWALNLQHRLGEMLQPFVEAGRPTLGICNGFQALVKCGILPGQPATLTYNASAQFECRWVYLQPQQGRSLFTEGLDELIYCPVAHGEGRLIAADSQALWNEGLVAFSYTAADGQSVGYPGSPNGSDLGIAGLTNAAGNVLGLMPHPENHIFAWQHPNWRRGEGGMLGLRLFENAIRYA